MQKKHLKGGVKLINIIFIIIMLILLLNYFYLIRLTIKEENLKKNKRNKFKFKNLPPKSLFNNKLKQAIKQDRGTDDG